MMRRVGLLLGIAALAVGPWVGSPSAAGVPPLVSYAAPFSAPNAQVAADDPSGPDGGGSVARRGCTCREVVVNAENTVRDAEVETGDAEVTNRSVTYIAPGFSDDEVEVDQEAEARSGDAIAGQILDVDGGGGCSRVHVRARNLVEEAEVRSGDATAKNESVVLIDPRLKRGDLEIDVEQDAEAKTGHAIAGQIINVRGGGGPCGGVIVDALNRLRDVELETGEAETDNDSDILTCESEGCIDEIREQLEGVDYVQVCSGDECEDVPVADFVEELEERAVADDEEDEDEDEEEDDEEEEDDDEEEVPAEEEEAADTKSKRRRRVQPPQPSSEPATDTVVQPEPTPEAAPADPAV